MTLRRRSAQRQEQISAETGLTERGTRIPLFGYSPNYHDIMTGSQPDGRAFLGNMNLTCNNDTSSEFGKVEVGHVDRTGLTDTAQAHSGNASHQSRDCSQPGLIFTGGMAQRAPTRGAPTNA
jgi:hypothetical protein